MEIVDGHALAPSEPGLGIDWDWDALKRLSVPEFTREFTGRK
jgi:L-alanine-DL-glutamate epimerase-like enolase superfamily enzyme